MYYEKAANAAKVSEKNFIDVFNRHFNKSGFYCESANAGDWYNSVDAIIKLLGYIFY